MTKILPPFSELKPTEYLLSYDHNPDTNHQIMLSFCHWHGDPKWRLFLLRYHSFDLGDGMWVGFSLQDSEGTPCCWDTPKEGLEYWYNHWSDWNEYVHGFVEPVPIGYLLILPIESEHQHAVTLRDCRYYRFMKASLLHKYKVYNGDIFSKDISPWLIVERFGTMNRFYLNKVPQDPFDDGGNFYEFGNWGDVDGIEDFEWGTAEDAYKFWCDNRAKILATNKDYEKYDNRYGAS